MEKSYPPPLNLPPLPPLSQTPPAIPARKALPPQTANLGNIQFLTPTSETCESSLEASKDSSHSHSESPLDHPQGALPDCSPSAVEINISLSGELKHGSALILVLLAMVWM